MERHPVDYTHIDTDFKSTSVLDHFIMNERLLSLVVGCGPLHLGDNRSRHSPIMVKLNLGAIPVKQVVLKKTQKRPAWYKAKLEDIESYTEDLDSRINNIVVPHSLGCEDMNCSDPEHTTERDGIVQDMLLTMIEACHSNIPIVGGKTVKTGNRADTACIPGWKEEVVPNMCTK